MEKLRPDKQTQKRAVKPPFFLTQQNWVAMNCLELVHRIGSAAGQQCFLAKEVLFVVVAHV